MRLTALAWLLLTVEASQWKNFKQKYEKVYRNDFDEKRHFQIFKQNVDIFEKHNEYYYKNLSGYLKGVNQFTDMYLDNENNKQIVQIKKQKKLHTFVEDIPESIDWRELGAVSEVQNTNTCGQGIWAFAVVDAIESHIYIKNKTSVKLSPQSLIDCDWYDGGCEFGKMQSAFKYVKQFGVSLENEYPFVGKKGTCLENSTFIRATAEQFGDDEEVLWGLVGRFGPVAVQIDASCLFFYATGILDETCGCTDTIQYPHYVLVVGYGIENGVKFWILKNNWGKYWGEYGYFRLKRNGPNICGIVSNPYYLVTDVTFLN